MICQRIAVVNPYLALRHNQLNCAQLDLKIQDIGTRKP